MPSGGGIRFDIGAEWNITPGEKRDFLIPVVDGDGDPIPDMTGWDVKFFLLRWLSDANGIPELEAGAILEKGGVLGAPNVQFSMLPGDWTVDGALLKPRTYWYELWRTDTGNEGRLAYGEFVTVP